jgi:hypothetical protein
MRPMMTRHGQIHQRFASSGVCGRFRPGADARPSSLAGPHSTTRMQAVTPRWVVVRAALGTQRVCGVRHAACVRR